jgi:hypothetical protein
LQTPVFAIVLVALTIAAYLPASHAGFIWDDDRYVTNNWLLTRPDGWQRMWFSINIPSQYFPLAYTTFRVERSIWALNATGYHWVNILLHAINALLLWRLLGRLGVPAAWLGAALFALHPVQVESVAWITELKNVQSLFFCLLALLAWIKFTESETKPAWVVYALCLLCYALALFSKTTACTLPAALFLANWLGAKFPLRKQLWLIAPFLVLGLGMGLVTMWWEHYHQGSLLP